MPRYSIQNNWKNKSTYLKIHAENDKRIEHYSEIIPGCNQVNCSTEPCFDEESFAIQEPRKCNFNLSTGVETAASTLIWKSLQMRIANYKQICMFMFLTFFAFVEQSEPLASQVPRFLLYHHPVQQIILKCVRSRQRQLLYAWISKSSTAKKKDKAQKHKPKFPSHIMTWRVLQVISHLHKTANTFSFK